MSNLILYIAGPMAFRADTDYNYPAFENAAYRLRAAGFSVISPHEVDKQNPVGSRHYRWYIRHTLKQLLDAQGVATLEGIEIAAGALRELSIAHELGMPRKPVNEWVRLAQEHPEQIALIMADIPSWHG